ncbi:MAG: 50S ribosomal protein L32 [bacterium]
MGIAQGVTTRSRRDKRRSHHFLKPVNLVECPQCHQMRLPHSACPHCGFYKGRKVLAIKEEE